MSGLSRRWLDRVTRKERDTLIARLHEQGVSVKHIAIRVNLSPTSVCKIIGKLQLLVETKRSVRMTGKATKPKCKLTGVDSNVFVLAGRVQKALRSAGQRENAKEFSGRLPGCKSYDEALQLMMEYVDVS